MWMRTVFGRGAFLVDQLQLFQPLQEQVRCSMRLLLVLGALERVQNLVPAVDAGPRLRMMRPSVSRNSGVK